MKKVEWQTELPARMQEFREIFREAKEWYTLFPNSPAETRLFVMESGQIGGRRMTGRWEMHSGEGLTWPIVDISAKFPQGRGFMNANVEIAFANAVRMRCEYFDYRAKQRMGRAS